MPIDDPELKELVKEQTQCFIDGASLEKKINVFKRIQKRQKKLMKDK